MAFFGLMPKDTLDTAFHDATFSFIVIQLVRYVVYAKYALSSVGNP